MKTIKNSSGSVLILTLTLVPIFLTCLFGLSYYLNFLSLQAQVQKVCFSDPPKAQREVVPQLTELLALNPMARKLKSTEGGLKIALAQAMIGLPETVALVTQLQEQLELVRAQRAALEKRQKQIIFASSRTMNNSMRTTNDWLNKIFKEHARTRPWLESKYQVKKGPEHGLAVEPELSDIAPPYRLRRNFESEQSLAHSWQVSLRVTSWLSNWMDQELKWRGTCSNTLGSHGQSFKVKSSLEKGS